MKLALTLICWNGLHAASPITARPFEFHSDFWLNLHHFLYEQAKLGSAGSQLNAEERKTWDNALALYRRSFVRRDLLFDPRLREIDTELAADESLQKLPLGGSEAALGEMLNTVAPIYRAHWWAAQDRANQAWIAAAVPLVNRYAPQLIKQLTTAFEAPWPRASIRVDLAEYSNWAGAYTYTHGPGRVHEIVSSKEPANQGYASLEILFHEASHGLAPGDSGKLADQIALSAKAHGVSAPKDLVHIFIFYTAGELTRRDLVLAGVENYVPYADKKGLYRMDWARWHDRIAVYWRKHLDGAMTLDDAVSAVVTKHER